MCSARRASSRSACTSDRRPSTLDVASLTSFFMRFSFSTASSSFLMRASRSARSCRCRASSPASSLEKALEITLRFSS